MSAGSNATMLNGHSRSRYGFDWQGGALIRCIGWLDDFLLCIQ
jgi:hypothetical protein